MITIDIRWLNESGMGTYLENIVPGIISSLSGEEYTLIGSRDQINRLRNKISKSVNRVETAIKPYSLAEQIILPFLIPSKTKLFFTTHFNAPILYRGKMIVTIYDLFHLNSRDSSVGFLGKIYALALMLGIKKNASAIITISEFTKNELIRSFGDFKIPIVPIHLGVSSEWYEGCQSKNDVNPYVVCLGNMKPHKNLNRFVQAFINISDRIPHNLVLIGKNDGFITGDKNVFKTASLMTSRIQFTGVMDQKDVIECVGGAEALAFPSLYEGFGLPPLEALASGVPVLASRIPSVEEICDSNVVYFDPYSVADIEEKLLKLLHDPILMEKLSLRGRKFAQQYTWQTCIEKTVNVMRALIS